MNLDSTLVKVLSLIFPTLLTLAGLFFAHRQKLKETKVEDKKTDINEMEAVVKANSDLREELRGAHVLDQKRILELESKGVDLKKEVDILFGKLRVCTEQHNAMEVKHLEMEAKNVATSKAYSTLKCEFEEHKLICLIYQKKEKGASA